MAIVTQLRGPSELYCPSRFTPAVARWNDAPKVTMPFGGGFDLLYEALHGIVVVGILGDLKLTFKF
jgi:hypothetical protein